MSFEFSKSLSTSKTFTSSTGITVGGSVEVECNVPFIGGGKVTASMEVAENLEWGSENA